MKPALLSLLLLVFFFSSKSQDTTYRGTEFWVGYGHHQFMSPSSNNAQNMTLYLATSTQPATVTITIDSSGNASIPATWWKRTYNIPANTVIDIEVTAANSFSTSAGSVGPIPKGVSGGYDARLYTDPPPVGQGLAGLYRRKAIHIESDVPVAAYSHIYGSASSGATMLIPVDAWGGLYTSANSNQNYSPDCYSWMYIIAKYDNTVVEITPSVKTLNQNYTGLQAGVAKTITLHKGWIYQVMGANLGSDANGVGGTSAQAYDLTGTVVRSVQSPTGYIHPIAVFSGSSRTSNPLTCGPSGGDNDMQQHFPRQAMGKIYLTAPFAGSTIASSTSTAMFKVVVNDPATVVSRNGVVLTGLINNSYYTFESNTPDLIEADQPILVAQFMSGGNCLAAAGLGDPEMIYLNPLSQGINSANFFRTNKETINTQYVNVILPTTGLATLTIDGSSTFDHTYTHPQMAGYSVVVKRWNPASKAQSVVVSTVPFVGITYGLGSVESYGYTLGTKLNAVAARDASQLPPGFTGAVFLPLNLTNFSVFKKDNDVLLRWSTTNEINVDRFEVERSLNGTDFTKFASVSAKQLPNADYNATDVNTLLVNAASKLIYYRLKMLDKDGSFKYSGIVTVKPGANYITEIKVAPNPFTDKLQLQVQTEASSTLKVSIRDASGRTFHIQTTNVAKGSSVIEIASLEKLQKGIYIVEVELNGNRQYVKVVK